MMLPSFHAGFLWCVCPQGQGSSNRSTEDKISILVAKLKHGHYSLSFLISFLQFSLPWEKFFICSILQLSWLIWRVRISHGVDCASELGQSLKKKIVHWEIPDNDFCDIKTGCHTFFLKGMYERTNVTMGYYFHTEVKKEICRPIPRRRQLGIFEMTSGQQKIR